MSKRAKTVNYKGQKKLFAKTAATSAAKSLNTRPRPQRGGFRI